MLYSAKITIREAHEKLADYLASIETKRERSTVKIGRADAKVIIDVEAKDATALRATMTSVTQSLSVFETTQQNG